MIIPILGLLALLSPLALGRSLAGLATIRFRGTWVVVLALLAQILVIEVFPRSDPTVLAAVHLMTYLAAGVFVLVNRRVPGLPVIALGALSNGITIALNGGTLPASPGALSRAGIALDPDEFMNSGVLTDPRLPWLGDVFAIPAGLPLANVFSVGDVLIVLGVGWGAHTVCRSKADPGLVRRLRHLGTRPQGPCGVPPISSADGDTLSHGAPGETNR